MTQEIENGVAFPESIKEIQRQDGNVVTIIGEVIGSRTLITERTRFQRYVDFSIPLSVNYAIDIDEKLNFYLTSGISYSFRQVNNGVTFQSANSVGEYLPLESLGYQSSGLVQGNFGIGIQHYCTRNIYLQGGLNVNFDLNNRLNSSVLASAKYRNYNLTIGVFSIIK